MKRNKVAHITLSVDPNKEVGRRKIEDKIWETLYHCATQPPTQHIVSKKLVKRIERLYNKIHTLGVVYTYL